MVAAGTHLYRRRGARDVADRRGGYQYRSTGRCGSRQFLCRAFLKPPDEQLLFAGNTRAARVSGAYDEKNSTHHAEPDYWSGLAKHTRAEAASAVQTVRCFSAI